MEKLLGHTPNGMGTANTLIMACLLDHFVTTGKLTRAEVAAILDHARGHLGGRFANVISAIDARDIISKMMSDYITEKRT